MRCEIEEVLGAIGESLACRALHEGTGALSLARGDAGTGLFLGWLARAMPHSGCREAAHRFLSSAAESLGQGVHDLSLFNGATGAAWALQKAGDLGFDLHAAELLADTDRNLAAAWSLEAWPEDASLDLVSGLAGQLLYCAHRGAAGVALAQRGVDLLAQRATRCGIGVHWREHPEQIAPAGLLRGLPEGSPLRASLQAAIEAFPRGRINLGVAHGTPGVVGALAGLANCGARSARPLLDAAANGLVAQRREAGRETAFGHFAGDEAESRCGWCYGDPGVAMQLVHAGRVLRRDDLMEAAIDTALRAARRPAASAGVVDAGLCHGSAGLAHLYGRLHQVLGQPELLQAARYWLRRTVRDAQVWRDGDAEGAVSTFHHEGLLEGLAGTGLALLASLTDDDPNWDSPLLMSLPCGQEQN